MRAFAILVASLLAFGGLAGCLGAKKEGDEPITQTGVTPGSGSGTGTGASTPSITVRAPLTSSVTIDAPAWVAGGTEVPVKATSNAKGAVTYAWAIGALPGTSTVAAVVMDTKIIAPGAQGSLTYAKSGVYSMHCHPHPFMKHNVTVIDGYAGAKAVDVFITDGAKEGEYRFVPENIVVPTGAVVTYKNVGEQPHTATIESPPTPGLKVLPLKAESGNVKIEGEGWQRVVAIISNAEGQLGIAQKEIYTTATLPAFETKTEKMDFEYGTPTALSPAPVAAQPRTVPVTLAHGGLVTINYTFSDAPSGAGAPENLAQVEGHFTKDGETQDTFTCDAASECSMGGKAPAGAYTLRIVPLQGAKMSGTIEITVVYELVPPPVGPPAAAAGGHGDHAGH